MGCSGMKGVLMNFKEIGNIILKNIEETGKTINTEKLHHELVGVQIVMGGLATASIIKHGIKGHIKRAWTNPGKQYGLGLAIGAIMIASCLEDKK
jgi:uncharacterized protein (DUF2147 family)